MIKFPYLQRQSNPLGSKGIAQVDLNLPSPSPPSYLGKVVGVKQVGIFFPKGVESVIIFIYINIYICKLHLFFPHRIFPNFVSAIAHSETVS